jgi:signal transduction histidine kinase
MEAEQSTLVESAAPLAAHWRALRGAAIPSAEAASEADVVRSLLASVFGDGTEAGLIAAGLEHGRAVHADGLPLYRLIGSIDGLEGLMLTDLREGDETESANRTEWMVTVERVHAACSLLTQAALQGFTRSMMTDLHKQYRDIRHDMKNPLGTIKNALSLMADAPAKEPNEAVQFRSMASRNTKALETLIRQRLADGAMEPRALVGSKVRLRELADEVRHSVAAAARAASVTIALADELSPECEAQVDGLAVRLLVRSVIATAIRCVGPRAEVTLGFAGNSGSTIRLRVSLTSGAALEAMACREDSDVWTEVRALAGELDARMTGDLVRERELFIEIPSLRGSGRHEGQDIAHARKAHDLEAGAL